MPQAWAQVAYDGAPRPMMQYPPAAGMAPPPYAAAAPQQQPRGAQAAPQKGTDVAAAAGGAAPVVAAAAAAAAVVKPKKKKVKANRVGGGEAWFDPTLEDWDKNDFRIFCGDLGNEVSDEGLARAFVKYPSIVRAKVVRDKKTQKSKGFGFVSFKDPNDFMTAMREMNGKYIGNRPVKLRKSTWKDRDVVEVKKKGKAIPQIKH